MDNIERYRAVVQRELEKIAATHYANGDYQRELVLDREHDRYLLVTLGWDGKQARLLYCDAYRHYRRENSGYRKIERTSKLTRI